MSIFKTRYRVVQGTARHVTGPQAACVGGYTFAPSGQQLIGQNGGGVPCQ